MAKGKSAISVKISQDDLLLMDMKKDCAALVKEALFTSEYTDRTGNLASSYGAAVYKDGVFLPDTLYTLDFNPTMPRYWYGVSKSGQEEMRRYFNNYKPKKAGYTIVLVAAMPYSEVLERGRNLSRKYRVISGAYGLMRELAEKYQGKKGNKRYKYAQGTRATLTELSNG